MPKASNGVRYSVSVKQEAKCLRSDGMTHREIAKRLGISTGTACEWTKGIDISTEQKRAIEERRNYHRMSDSEKRVAGERLAPFRVKFSKDELLEKIRGFYLQNGRIPLKREFNAWHTYFAMFGSWNKAIEEAGFDTNPVLFAKKFTATDGHVCDSFTEKVIDDWLTAKEIAHERNCSYGNSKFTADFKIHLNTFVEFFGLTGVNKAYDANIEKKRLLAKTLGYKLIEIYPKDIYPRNRLSELLGDVPCRAAEN